MLIAILIFILASVFIVSLVTSALDKPKEAGILGDFNHYDNAGVLLLKSASNSLSESDLESDFNKGLNKAVVFDANGSLKKNAYGNNYNLAITKGAVQTTIEVGTTGKSDKKKYGLVVVKEGKTVESCTFGFGRNNKKLPTLKHPLCNGAIPDTGTEEPPFTPVAVVPDGCTGITTAAELDAVRNDMTDCYVVMNPIDLSSYPTWEPLFDTSIPDDEGWFTGTFDGQRYPITGLTIDKAGVYYVGLFSDAEEGAVIKNVNLVNVDVTGGKATGGLVGYLDNATIENSSVSGTVNGTNRFIGGLSGQVYTSTITNSHSDTSVSSESTITGGLVGYGEDVTISDSYSKGSVIGKDMIGGLVGQLDAYNTTSSVTDSYSTAAVTATASSADAAGLVSSIQGTTIENSYATGAVKSTSSDIGTGTVGGLVGDSNDSTIKNSYATGSVTGNGIAGGFIGNSTNLMLIENSYSTGAVTNNDNTSNLHEQYTGGFAGNIGIGIVIKNSYSTSTVTGNLTQPTDAIGGFAGFANYDTTIENSHYFGVATSSSINGGFIGFIPPEYTAEVLVTNSFYSSDNTGKNDAIFGTPLTTSEFAQESAFTGWNFTDIWEIKGSAYPTLK
jgi:hypothetical protein